jgi:hypothetical protein
MCSGANFDSRSVRKYIFSLSPKFSFLISSMTYLQCYIMVFWSEVYFFLFT